MIYINARFLTQSITGVQRFAIEISKELKDLMGDNIRFVSPPDILHKEIAKYLAVEIIGKRKGHLWEQIDLPQFLKRRNNPFLLNLCSTAPIYYSNQIITHHDITYIRYPKSFSLAFRTLYRLIIPQILKHSKGLITVSNFSKNEISQYYKYPLEKIHIIYNAVNQNFKPKENFSSESKKSSSTKYLLAVSSNNYHKNFKGLVEAFSLISKDIDVKLLIVGNYDSKSFKHIKLDSLNNRVKFVGRISDQELIKLYQSAEAFIFPSLYEGFGIPPLEAQACGCPVLASNVASIPEILQASSLFFDPLDINSMTIAITKILTTPNLRIELREKGIDNVKRYSWKSSAKEIINIIKKQKVEI